MLTLSLLFFIVALVYSTVGFGGGSSYIALLAVSGLSHSTIPKISLLCNILVVTGACYQYARKGHLIRELAAPLVLSSVPMAFLGGTIPLKEKTFFILLTLCLLFCGLRILIIRDKAVNDIRRPSVWAATAVGSVLGLLSGMVGIGGGIFLSPLMINLGWARSKDAAAVASVFILLNSLAGLAGQFAKAPVVPEVYIYLPLFIAVIIGGQIGSRLGTHTRVSYTLIQKATGLLTLFITFQLLLKIMA